MIHKPESTTRLKKRGAIPNGQQKRRPPQHPVLQKNCAAGQTGSIRTTRLPLPDLLNDTHRNGEAQAKQHCWLGRRTHRRRRRNVRTTSRMFVLQPIQGRHQTKHETQARHNLQTLGGQSKVGGGVMDLVHPPTQGYPPPFFWGVRSATLGSKATKATPGNWARRARMSGRKRQRHQALSLQSPGREEEAVVPTHRVALWDSERRPTASSLPRPPRT